MIKNLKALTDFFKLGKTNKINKSKVKCTIIPSLTKFQLGNKLKEEN